MPGDSEPQQANAKGGHLLGHLGLFTRKWMVANLPEHLFGARRAVHGAVLVGVPRPGFIKGLGKTVGVVEDAV